MTRAFLLRLFIPYALGNILGAFYRTVMAVVAPDLIHDLGLGAEDLGLLTSVYFMIFAATQLPLGVLLDRYGARRVTAILFVFAGAGSILFATAQQMPMLAFARILMGLGMSVALMGGLKAMVDWLPRERVAFGNGIILMAGGLGSMSATIPVQWALSVTDWRGVFVVLGLVTLAAAVVVHFVAPEQPREAHERSVAEVVRGLIEVLTHRTFLRSAPLGGVIMGVSMSVNNLWSGPWLRDVTNLPRDQISHVLFVMAAMMTISAFFAGSIVLRLQKIGITMLNAACTGIAIYIAFQILLISDIPVSPYVVWLPMAFFATAPTLIYSVLTSSFPHELGGRVNTAYNFVAFTVSFIAQWSIGAVIDLWPPVSDGHFAPVGYRVGLAIMVVCEIAAFAWLFASRTWAARKP